MKLASLLALVALAAGLFCGSSLSLAADQELPPVQTVPQVDLARYMGKWYEIASFPMRFQRDCVASTATYTLREDGDVDVLNECRNKTFDGELRSVHGKAWVPNKAEPGKLRVRFFWPFSAPYWILEIGPNYEYAVVGNPKRDYLWILSRERTLAPEVYHAILERVRKQGFDLSRLQKTPQLP